MRTSKEISHDLVATQEAINAIGLTLADRLDCEKRYCELKREWVKCTTMPGSVKP